MSKVNSIEVFPAELKLAKGDWYYGALVWVDPENIDCKEVIWHSSNPDIATVNPSTGYIYAENLGVARIYATATDGSECNDYICLEVVEFVPVSSVEIQADCIRVEKGTTRILDVTISPMSATYKSLEWTTSDPRVALVEDGVIYGVSEGTARITVNPTDCGGGCGDCRIIEVTNDNLVGSITIYPETKTMQVGESAMLNAIVCPTDATNSEIRWSSNDPRIVTVNEYSGLLTAIGKGTTQICAEAADGSGVKCYCTITVEETIPVTSITITPPDRTVWAGGSMSLNATVLPENATNKALRWYSERPEIATVDEYSGKVYGHEAGYAKIWASARDNSGVEASCWVDVDYYIPITKVRIPKESVTLHIGETYYIGAQTCPDYATETAEIEYSSSIPSRATVDKHTGLVTALSEGPTTITARTTDGRFSANCKVTVDPREKVLIKKDSHSFYVKFEDGTIWKNIGIDLSNRQENYTQIPPPKMWHESYDCLIEEEQRYLDNAYVEKNGVMDYKTYSVKQIAYLYLFDPLGIEYYMKHEACAGKDSTETLFFKDNVYKAIFGNSEEISGRFYFTIVDGIPQYCQCDDRSNVYSNAEVLFGFNTIINWDWGEFIKSVLQGLFEWAMEDSIVGKGIQAYQILFHAGGILGVCSDQASSFVTEYAQEGIDRCIKEKFGEKVLKPCHWAFTLTSILADSALSAFSIPNPEDITIYNNIYAEPEFFTIIDGFDGDWSIKDIIDKVHQN